MLRPDRCTRPLRALLTALTLTGLSACGPDPQALLAQAKSHWDQGQYQTATNELRIVLQRDPASAEARWLLGRALYTYGDLEGAAKELERAQEQGWTDPQARELLLSTYLALNDNQKVIDATSDVGSDPKDAELLALRGLAQLGYQRKEAARTSFERAAQLNPDSLYAQIGLFRLSLMVPDVDAADRALAQAERAHPDNPAVWQNRGWLELLRRDPDASVAAYRRALELAPTSVPTRIGLARARLAANQIDAAAADLNALQEEFPQHPAVLYLSAVVAYLRDDTAKAVDLLRAVLSFVPNQVESQMLLAQVLFRQDQTAQSEELLTRVLAQRPQLASAKKLMAAVKLRLANPDGAIAQLSALDRAEMDDPRTLAMMADAYTAKGDFGKSRELLLQAAEAAPEAQAVKLRLAQIRTLTGEEAEGMAEIEALAEADTGIERADALSISLHIRNGDFAKLLEDADRLARKIPDSPAPDNIRGVAYYMQGDPDAARAAFEQALQRDPRYVDARINLANLDAAQGRTDAARQRYREILKEQPGHAVTLTALARMDLDAGRTEEALAGLKRARDADPQTYPARLILANIYLARGDNAGAMALAEEMWKIRPGDPSTLLAYGRAALGIGQPDKALPAFQSLVAQEPGQAPTLLLLAETYNRLARYADAQIILDKVLELEPDSVEALVAATRLSLTQKQQGEAREYAARLLQHHPEAYESQVITGDIAFAAGQWKNAAQAYQRAAELKPSAESIIRAAGAWQRAGDDDTAGKILDPWVSEHPDDVLPGVMLAVARGRGGDTARAITVLESLRKRHPEDPNVLNNLAWFYFKSDDDRAQAVAEKAAERAPDDPNVADTLGWILVNRGLADRGVNLLQKASTSRPDDADVRYRLAVALLKTGNRDGARKEVRKALATAQFSERDNALRLADSLR